METKIKILDCLSSGQKTAAVSRKFNLSDSTIRTIKQSENAIRSAVATGTDISSKSASYTRNSVVERTERALILWIEDCTQKRLPLDGQLIKEKALRLSHLFLEQDTTCSTEGKIKSFTASSGWFYGFLDRYSLHNVKIRGESASADMAAASEYPAKLATIIKEGGYSADQVYNADETGLYWKKMPSRTYIAKAEKVASGFKAAKERITLLFCSNASGDHLLKPLLINRSQRPRAMKGMDFKHLPVHWMANSKAWVTTAVFKEWFEEMFIPEVQEYLEGKGQEFRVLLLLDNAPGHPPIEHPNVKVIFLPPNTTSIIQPQDQGIISTFKKAYIKKTFRHILEATENDTSLTLVDAWKAFTMRECTEYVGSALREIKPSTLNACWRPVWPECVTKPMRSQDLMDNSEIFMLAHAIGGEGFSDLTDTDVEELINEPGLADAELVELVEDNKNSAESDDMEISEENLNKGLEIAEQLENHFVQHDPYVERAVSFRNDLKYCLARYKELNKAGAK